MARGSLTGADMDTFDDLPSFLVLAPYDRPPLIWGTESWVLSDRAGQASSVVGGPLDGASLTELVDRFGVRLAGSRGVRSDGRLALLVKLLSTHDRLSVQVHPGWSDLPALPPGAESKEEAWLVLGAEPGARIILGTRPGCTREAFAAAVATGTVEAELASFEPRPGDVLHVRPGTLHAIGAGLRLAEVQESSDTTYRVWDWGRVEANGRPRALHVAEALAVTRFARTSEADLTPGAGALSPSGRRLLQAGPFVMDWTVPGAAAPLAGLPDRFVAHTLLVGSAKVRGPAGDQPLAMLQTVLVPPRGHVVLEGCTPGAAFLSVTLP